MEIDASRFPVVRMRENAQVNQPVGTVLEHYVHLLQRDEPFVVIADTFPSQGDRKQERGEDRRAVTMCMKAHKTEISRLIKGHIQVVKNAELRPEAKQFATIFQKFWGYPMFVVATEDEALFMAVTLLHD